MTINWQSLDTGIQLDGSDETHAAGIWIGSHTPPGTTLALSGDLGYGKTTLAKGIAAGWGVTTTVKSPTYNYFLTYQSDKGLLVHLDAYRLSGSDEYESLMIDDILEDPWLLIVEWPENVQDCLPIPTWHFQIESPSPAHRRLTRTTIDS